MFKFLKRNNTNDIAQPETVAPVAPALEIEAKTGLFSRLKQGLQRTRTQLSAGLASLILGKKEIDAELLDEITQRYMEQTSPYYAAARLWTDAIIDPLDTRKWISLGIEAANHAPIEKQFNLGVIQV